MSQPNEIAAKNAPLRYANKTTWPTFGKFLICGVFFSLVSLGLAHMAQARVLRHVENAGLSLGRSLLATLNERVRSGSASGLGAARVLNVNGAKMRVQSTSLPLSENSLQDLVNTVRDDCQEGRTSSVELRNLTPPVLEAIAEREAFIACLKPSSTLTQENLGSLLSHITQNSDLSALGTFQGIYARVEGDAISLLAVEILEGFAPARMFPQNTDCPGKDHEELPRPSGRRTLAASLSEKTILTSYIVRGSAEEALLNYETQLRSKGANISHPNLEPMPGSAPAFIVRTEGESFVITAVGLAKLSEESSLTAARLPQ